MSDPEKESSRADKRTDLITTIQTPLGFFVLSVLVIEAALGALVVSADCPERASLIRWMLMVLALTILVVATLAYFRPEALQGSRYRSVAAKYSLWIGPPQKMEGLDITFVDWDDDNCFLVRGSSRERVSLVPSRVGPSFRVQIPERVLDAIDAAEAISLDLRDRKGNRWSVKRFYLFENLVPLAIGEEPEKLYRDYGGDY